MDIKHTKARCHLCFKQFIITELLHPKPDVYLFINRQLEIKYFDWNKSSNITQQVNHILSTNPELALENENTKGITALKLIEKLSKENVRLISKVERCPRCSLKFLNKNNKTTCIEQATPLFL